MLCTRGGAGYLPLTFFPLNEFRCGWRFALTLARSAAALSMQFLAQAGVFVVADEQFFL
jgi:hypothetical protein